MTASRLRGCGLVLAVLLLAPGADALTLDLSILAAYRTVRSPQIRDVYGNGFVAAPALGVRVWDGLSLTAGGELGYDRSGRIGLYDEKTRLTVSGWEAFALWEIAGRRWVPYLKAGMARLSYKQTIEAAPPLSLQARGRRTVTLLGAGLRAKLAAPLFGFVEIQYLPLKVKPFDSEVDLGGWRIGLGLGAALKL
jgi:hypothetical protein